MHRPLPCLISLWVLLAVAAQSPADESAEAKPDAGLTPDSAALFDRLDRNGDGKLTADEVPEDKQTLFRRLLQTSDKGGDGSLSRDEFAAGLESKRAPRDLTEKLPDDNPMGQLLKNPDKFFNRLDKNADGQIVAAEVPEQARGMFEKMLTYADKNSDGVLTRQELSDAAAQLKSTAAASVADMEPAKLFDYLDKNADGKLTADELPEGRPMLQQLMKRGDKDGDGALSQEEFTTTLTAWRRLGKGQLGDAPAGQPSAGSPAEMTKKGQGKGNPQRLLQRFSKMDANHDGKISRDEFAGPQQKRFDRIDANGDGYLEKDELERFATAAGQKMRTAAAGLKAKADARMPAKDEAKPAGNAAKDDAD